MRAGIEDVVFAFCGSRRGLRPTCTSLGSIRTRSARLTVVGAQRMATFDDMELERKLTIYDKGFDERADSWGEYITRSGE